MAVTPCRLKQRIPLAIPGSTSQSQDSEASSAATSSSGVTPQGQRQDSFGIFPKTPRGKAGKAPPRFLKDSPWSRESAPNSSRIILTNSSRILLPAGKMHRDSLRILLRDSLKMLPTDSLRNSPHGKGKVPEFPKDSPHKFLKDSPPKFPKDFPHKFLKDSSGGAGTAPREVPENPGAAAAFPLREEFRTNPSASRRDRQLPEFSRRSRKSGKRPGMFLGKAQTLLTRLSAGPWERSRRT